MNFQAVKDSVLSTFDRAALYSDLILSEAVFHTVRDTQESCECSVMDYVFTPSSSTQKIVLAGLTYSLVNGEYGWEDDDLEATIHGIYVENVFNSATMSEETRLSGFTKNDFDADTSGNLKIVCVDYDKSSIVIFFKYDLKDQTVTVRLRYIVDYIEGEFAVGSRVNLLLSMIPVQMRRYLVDGIKYYFYKLLAERTGDKDLKLKSKEYEIEWKNVKLPYMEKMMDKNLMNNAFYSPKPPRVISLDDV